MLTEDEVIKAFNNVVEIHNNIQDVVDVGMKAQAEGLHFGVSHDLLVRVVETILIEHFEVPPDQLEEMMPNIVYATRQGVLVGIELGKLVALISKVGEAPEVA